MRVVVDLKDPLLGALSSIHQTRRCSCLYFLRIGFKKLLSSDRPSGMIDFLFAR